MTFTALIDSFKGFFSRSFWFGSFLPVAILAAAHFGLSALIFNFPTADQIKAGIGDTPGLALLVFVAVVILAYAIGPLTPLFHGVLDGTLMPGVLHDHLRRERSEQWRNQVAEYREAQARFATVSDERFTEQLRAARKKLEDAGNDAKEPLSPDRRAQLGKGIETAEKELEKLKQKAERLWDKGLEAAPPVDLKELADAKEAVIRALHEDVAALDKSEPDSRWMARADCLTRKFHSLHREAKTEARHRYIAVARRMPNLDLHDWQPTRLGDARYRRDRYARDTYGASFDFLWPRIRLAIGDGDQDDSKGLPRSVADGAARTDFAALLLVLSLTIPAVWLPVIIAYNKSVVAFLAIGLATPVVIAMCYELLIRSEMAFGEIVQTAIDRYHLAVFPLLGIPLPATLSAERELWSRLERASWSGPSTELVYRHQPAAGE